MTQKLTKMEIDRIDLVDAGANGRRFALFKRAAAGAAVSEVDEGFIAKVTKAIGDGISKAFGIPEPVEKAMTFAQIVAGREVNQALEEHWYTLSDALWSAIYATDDEGNDLSLDAKKGLVATNLDEFKAFLLERMDSGVTKGDGPMDARLFTAFIAKVGKKVSAARLARLNEAATALGAVLAEVEADDESAETEKRATPQEENDVDKEQLEEVLKAHLTPIAERLEALEKGRGSGEPVAKGDEGEGDDPVTLEVVAEAIGKMGDRLEAIEKRRGERQSAGGEETKVKKEAGAWAGIL